MKILIVGGGGREHAIAWKVAASPRVSKVFCAPGNPGTESFAENISTSPDDLQALLEFARKNHISLTVVGPEQPLALGIVNLFNKNGLPIFGPTREAALLEGSKAFSKGFMTRHSIPTGAYCVFSSPDKAASYLESSAYPVVVKADGLAAGKGVLICKGKEEAIEAVNSFMVDKKFGEAGEKIVIEEFLTGEEASFMAVCDGKNVLPLICARDHKQVFDGNRGPNTGGMGAYAPSPLIDKELEEDILNTIILPAVRGMEAEGRPFSGVLYAGVMINDRVAKTLEFNCRFGDPETQPILMKLKSDIVTIFEAAVSGTISEIEVEWERGAAACVVLASGGYPGNFDKGMIISGLDSVEENRSTKIFHAGTEVRNGKLVTSGGRVLGVTAMGKDIPSAVSRAYTEARKISWDEMHYRKDIGRAIAYKKDSC